MMDISFIRLLLLVLFICSVGNLAASIADQKSKSTEPQKVLPVKTAEVDTSIALFSAALNVVQTTDIKIDATRTSEDE